MKKSIFLILVLLASTLNLAGQTSENILEVAYLDPEWTLSQNELNYTLFAFNVTISVWNRQPEAVSISFPNSCELTPEIDGKIAQGVSVGVEVVCFDAVTLETYPPGETTTTTHFYVGISLNVSQLPEGKYVLYYPSSRFIIYNATILVNSETTIMNPELPQNWGEVQTSTNIQNTPLLRVVTLTSIAGLGMATLLYKKKE